MRAGTDTTTAQAGSRGRSLQPPRYGAPSPALLARADRGFARFLAQQTVDAQTRAEEEHA